MTSLEWQGMNQLRWHGEYEVLQIAADSFQCQVAQFRLVALGENLEVDYLAEKGFMLHAEPFLRIELERH